MTPAPDAWPEQASWSRGLWLQLARALLGLVLLPARLIWSVIRAGPRRRNLAEQLRHSSRTARAPSSRPPHSPEST